MSAVHGKETAAAHVVHHVPTARATDSAAEVRGRLVGEKFDAVDAVYVLGDSNELLGTVLLPDLLVAPPESPLAAIMKQKPAVVRLSDDQEHVASVAIRHGLTAVAVVDANGHFEGVVPPRALILVLRREHIEDLHRLAGIRGQERQARSALEAPPLRRARDRLPWLLVGLAGSALATLIMARFERRLESQVAIAFFVPGIVYLADAIGTQTEAIAVRGLSLSQASIGHLVAGELRTGLVVGGFLSCFAFAGVTLGLGDARLGLAVGAALLAAGTVASSIGLLLPWLLKRMGTDPAFGSGPLATVVQDILSLMIYFASISLLAR